MAMDHPKNLTSPWSRFFVNEIEFGHSYSPGRKLVNATKVVYSFEASRRLRALLSEFKPDVAHAHCIYHHLSPSVLWTLRRANIPVVLTAHDLKVLCPAYKMLNSLGICERCKNHSVFNAVRYKCVHGSRTVSALVAIEAALHRTLKTYEKTVDMIVAPSQFFVDKFLEWGWSDKKIRLVRNFVDERDAPIRQEHGDYFLYFGRLSIEKGVGTLLTAARDAGIRLFIAGTGPEEKRLRELATTLRANVEFLGFRTGDDLRRIVQGALAVVLPSEWYENNPMSVLEAFSLERPVVGARIGGIPELVVEGSTGLLFESGNVADLTRALRAVISMPKSTLDALGANGRCLVQTSYSRATYVESTLDVYRSLGISC